jgi:hypothetical protein
LWKKIRRRLSIEVLDDAPTEQFSPSATKFEMIVTRAFPTSHIGMCPPTDETFDAGPYQAPCFVEFNVTCGEIVSLEETVRVTDGIVAFAVRERWFDDALSRKNCDNGILLHPGFNRRRADNQRRRQGGLL